MTSELKDGQIVGIVSPDRFVGCSLDIELVKFADKETLEEFMIDKKTYSVIIGENTLRHVDVGIQYTFPELAPVLRPGKVVKKNP